MRYLLILTTILTFSCAHLSATQCMHDCNKRFIENNDRDLLIHCQNTCAKMYGECKN